MQRWFRNEPLFAGAMLVGIIIIGTGEVVKHGSELLVAIGLKQEKTLELANDTAKAEFSRRLIEAAWRRVFWTRNFVRRVELARPSTELDYSWNKYLDTVADWSASIMVNINGLEQYYAGSEKPSQFGAIQAKFLALEELLVTLRISDSGNADKDLIARTKGLVDEINEDLYFFALNRSSAKKSPTCAVTILAPRDNEAVRGSFEVRGKANIPNGTYLWVLFRQGSTRSDGWYPKGRRPATLAPRTGEWVAAVDLTRAVDSTGDIAVVVVDADTNARLQNWSRQSQDNNYPPIEYPTPVEGCPAATVRVNVTR
jgi:hypothetical protein